jgi:3-oxoisoapionate kinase
MPLDPGAPLCVGHRRHAPEIEIVLKGGQIGRTDFYGLAKAGGGC